MGAWAGGGNEDGEEDAEVAGVATAGGAASGIGIGGRSSGGGGSRDGSGDVAATVIVSMKLLRDL
uniref:Uncharacterized protein n=1 Tax=Oryza sativa subsp. japonica TaxID=39947 RepID=Q6K665_ORYSJ|nr:hypothetical protein [Oryza sativa Japonica Group]BAD23215.1 hypothetical protein [Oryza sativa Japonica Group]